MAKASSRICTTITIAITLAAFAPSFGSAKAADDSDCCSNLEDRIAKLESKVDKGVDKGNGKVSVDISGWATKSMDWWSDGAGQPSKPSQQR